MKKSLKTILVALTVLFSVSSVFSFLAAPSTFAEDPPTPSDNCRTYLGFRSWDCGVDIEEINSTPNLSKAIWTIVVNVATDLTVAASYLVLGFVMYGGFLYIFSAGEPQKAAMGKKTLSQAFIGLAIVLSANVIMNAIRIALGGVNLQECLQTSGEVFSSACYNNSAEGIVTSAISWIFGIIGVVAVVFVVYGAISYITSGGDVGKVQKAKLTIFYALIGLAIVALAEVITGFVSAMINRAVQEAELEPTTKIALIEKEYHENH